MKTTALYITKFVSLGFLSSSLFLVSSFALPLKTKSTQVQSHLPKMSVELSDFSAAWAAMEDDYYVSDYQFEKIPENIPAQPLELGKVNMLLAASAPGKSSITFPSQKFAVSLPAPVIPRQVSAAVPAEIQPQAMGIRVPHHWIQGKIELSGGLAISHPRDVINVGWMVDGRAERAGQINLQDGTYEIKVDFMDGELLAELVDSKGLLLGEAILDLELLSKKRDTNQLIVKNVDIKIEPYQFGFSAQTVAIYDSPGNKSPVEKVNVRVGKHDLYFQSEKDGLVREESVSPHSSGMITASRSQFRDTMLLADFEREQKIRMFPDKFLTALFDTVKLDTRARDRGMIWGLVNQYQVPTAGYQVRVADHPELQPIYFNTYIAERSQKQTSGDGQYVFLDMPDGEFEIEVLNGLGQRVDSKLVNVQAGFVTQAEFELGQKKTMTVRAFEPLANSLRDVQIAVMGSDAIHTVKTEEPLKVSVSSGSDPLLVYTRVEGVDIDTSVFVSRQRKSVDVPVLDASWWQRMSGQFQVRPETGVVVGFIDTDVPFEVFVEEMNPQTQVVYFNHAGEIIPPVQDRRLTGQIPNGFIVFGAGNGLKTLVIQSESGRVATEMALLDGESISLMYKAL